MKRLFIAGIGTDVGKTVISSILCQALDADYWKPVQTGASGGTDREVVAQLVRNSRSRFFPESYTFRDAVSPHLASHRENRPIHLESIVCPKTDQTLVIESAGGLLSPLNQTQFMSDLARYLSAEIILVSRNYVGSINHTLLAIEHLFHRDLKVRGIIFNGPSAPECEELIERHSGLQRLGTVHEEPGLTPAVIQRYSERFKNI